MAQLQKSDLDDNVADLIKKKFPGMEIKTVFDVGANIGWVTISFLNAFKNAKVWSFEPVPAVYEKMLENVGSLADSTRVQFVELALGASNKQARMTNLPGSGVTVNKIIDSTNDGDFIEVSMASGDNYCLAKGISHIDYLKIDTEGHDMEVLIGFGGMLSDGNVDFVQVQAGISSNNKDHVNIKLFEEFLLPLGYRLMSVVNQASSNIPYLLYADTIFVREGISK